VKPRGSIKFIQRKEGKLIFQGLNVENVEEGDNAVSWKARGKKCLRIPGFRE